MNQRLTPKPDFYQKLRRILAVSEEKPVGGTVLMALFCAGVVPLRSTWAHHPSEAPADRQSLLTCLIT